VSDRECLRDQREASIRRLHRLSANRSGPNLRDVLAPRLFSDATMVKRMADWMRQGRALVIPEALPNDLAERVYHDLHSRTDWETQEGGHDFFHYRNYVIENVNGRSSALTECHSIFNSSDTRRFMTELSGRDCGGRGGARAAWYRPGDYSLPHNDVMGLRSVAFIWYMTKDWQHEWGGSLYWCPTGQYVSPHFNTLTIFPVTKSNFHFICPVALTATQKRMSINGFWHRLGSPIPAVEVERDAVVSPQGYGPLPPEDIDGRSLLVL
jgi:hypothetical protein